jgi:hypothetical protein
MIKATELMIGDWVLVSGTPRRVESITKKKIGYHINPQTDNRFYYARLHDVEPIELTEDLLKKIGFWRDLKIHFVYACRDYIDGTYEWSADYLIKEGLLKITVDKTYHPLRDDNDLNCVLYPNLMVEAKYLHELQHAFCCCKIFFTIKL